MRKGVSHLYALVKTVEFDVVLGDDSFARRVELFQDKTRRRKVRAERERFELSRPLRAYGISSAAPSTELGDRSGFTVSNGAR